MLDRTRLVFPSIVMNPETHFRLVQSKSIGLTLFSRSARELWSEHWPDRFDPKYESGDSDFLSFSLILVQLHMNIMGRQVEKKQFVEFMSENLGMLHFNCRKNHDLAEPREAFPEDTKDIIMLSQASSDLELSEHGSRVEYVSVNHKKGGPTLLQMSSLDNDAAHHSSDDVPDSPARWRPADNPDAPMTSEPPPPLARSTPVSPVRTSPTSRSPSRSPRSKHRSRSNRSSPRSPRSPRSNRSSPRSPRSKSVEDEEVFRSPTASIRSKSADDETTQGAAPATTSLGITSPKSDRGQSPKKHRSPRISLSAPPTGIFRRESLSPIDCLSAELIRNLSVNDIDRQEEDVVLGLKLEPIIDENSPTTTAITARAVSNNETQSVQINDRVEEVSLFQGSSFLLHLPAGNVTSPVVLSFKLTTTVEGDQTGGIVAEEEDDEDSEAAGEAMVRLLDNSDYNSMMKYMNAMISDRYDEHGSASHPRRRHRLHPRSRRRRHGLPTYRSSHRTSLISSRRYRPTVIYRTSTTKIRRSKVFFISRCINDQSCQTILRLILENIDSDKRLARHYKTPGPTASLVRKLTQTAWIGPRDCLINEVLFKTLPLVSYPELHQLADKVSNMLATKVGLPVIYNSIVVNVCKRTRDVYEWSLDELDDVVFESSKPLSIITVGVTRKLHILERVGGGDVGVVIMGNAKLKPHCERDNVSLSGQCSDHSSRALREKRESGQANALTDRLITISKVLRC
eukprot:sb/3462426/